MWEESLKSIFPIILFFQPNPLPLHCAQVVKTMSRLLVQTFVFKSP